jgi:trimeric autotransporter adhesin
MMIAKLQGFVKTTVFAGLLALTACTSASAPAMSESIDARCGSRSPSCNVLAGYSGNSVNAGIIGATIAGGGLVGLPNQVNGDGGTVSGGTGNIAGEGSVVAGGSGNTALYFHAAVGGGASNTAAAEESTVAGGLNNTASDRFAAVGGGASNLASANYTTVAGGSGNTSSYQFAAVGGGTENQSTSEASVVSGGTHNFSTGSYSAVGGGANNNSAGSAAAVAGGAGNVASGAYAAVPGGFANQAAADYSFAAGRTAVVRAADPGAFLFADSTNFPFPSITPNEFAVRATGGVRFVTALDSSGNPLSGVRLSPGSGSWESLSDANAKAALQPVEGNQVLDALMSIPVSTWSYKGQDPSIRHIGPMAQDFYSAFHVGTDNRYISTVDEEGVALAAIQQLYRLVQQNSGGGSQSSATVDSTLPAQVSSLQHQLTFSNGLAGASLLIACLALWRRKKGTK